MGKGQSNIAFNGYRAQAGWPEDELLVPVLKRWPLLQWIDWLCPQTAHAPEVNVLGRPYVVDWTVFVPRV